MRKHAEINIYGKVQGVRFRWSAREIGEQLGLVGYVKNMPDGSVFAEVEGEEDALDEFIDWCEIGPLLADVRQVDVSMSEKLKGFHQFDSFYKNKQEDFYYATESRFLI